MLFLPSFKRESFVEQFPTLDDDKLLLEILDPISDVEELKPPPPILLPLLQREIIVVLIFLSSFVTFCGFDDCCCCWLFGSKLLISALLDDENENEGVDNILVEGFFDCSFKLELEHLLLSCCFDNDDDGGRSVTFVVVDRRRLQVPIMEYQIFIRINNNIMITNEIQFKILLNTFTHTHKIKKQHY